MLMAWVLTIVILVVRPHRHAASFCPLPRPVLSGSGSGAGPGA